jgi:hypothetical protein
MPRTAIFSKATIARVLKTELGREPTEGEFISFILGLRQALNLVGVSLTQSPLPTAEGKKIVIEERPGEKKTYGLTIECPHCHKQTPHDSTVCIHCNQKIR